MYQFLFRISIKCLSCSLKITMMMRISSHLHLQKDFKNPAHNAQKMKFSTKHFFSKCDQILRKLRMWSHLLKETSMENFIFRAVSLEEYDWCLSEDCWYVLQSFYTFIAELIGKITFGNITPFQVWFHLLLLRMTFLEGPWRGIINTTVFKKKDKSFHRIQQK